VTISTATPGAKIYYTTNGTTPTTSSSVYSDPITVSSSETREAIAGETGYKTSAVATAGYTINQRRHPRNKSR
jgi:Chitobiase/beta-hexosaminidase C-terminal domain